MPVEHYVLHKTQLVRLLTEYEDSVNSFCGFLGFFKAHWLMFSIDNSIPKYKHCIFAMPLHETVHEKNRSFCVWDNETDNYETSPHLLPFWVIVLRSIGVPFRQFCGQQLTQVLHHQHIDLHCLFDVNVFVSVLDWMMFK